MDLQKHNIYFVSPYEVLSKKEKDFSVMVAFSGGADSSLLLKLIAEDSKKYNYKVYVAHFNHQIRGEEAKRDENFCIKTAKNYGFECFIGSEDIPSLSKNSGVGVECVARDCRYKFLSDTMKQLGCKVLLTAHNADDRAETFFINLLRGSGLNGLSGIKAMRNLGENQIVFRPLLDTKKVDIYAYCKENNIDFVEDSTNLDTTYRRNDIRHNLIPEILKLQPDFFEIIKRTTESINDDTEYLNALAKNVFSGFDLKDGISISDLNLSNAILSRIIRLYFAEFSSATLEHIHISNVIALIKSEKNGASTSLPQKHIATIKHNHLFIEKQKKQNEKLDFFIPLNFGKSETEYYIINVEKIISTAKPQKNQLILKDIDGLYFSPRKESDEILVSSMHKKVRKLQNQQKIDADKRDDIPILRNKDGEILWLPFTAVSDIVKSEKNGEILITISKKDTI